VTFNVAEATINGLELDIKALPVDGWSIGFNFGYLDAEYDDFYANLRGTDPATGLEYPATDNSGLILRRAPEFTFALSSLYEVPIGAGIGSLQLSYRYKDDFETDFRNFEAGHVDAHGLFDASINYEIDSWRFSIFGRNLTDEDQVSAVVNVYGIITFGAVRDPRTWGGEVTYTFE
jgi:iron complex outermembrane receptor protein